MMNSTMISYTPTEELPMPPQWMLDELELEVTKNRTPSATAIHNALAKEEYSHLDENKYVTLNILKRSRNINSKAFKNSFSTDVNYDLNTDFFDIIHYKNQKKGIKNGMKELANCLFNLWKKMITINEYKKSYPYELIEVGFMPWLLHNLKLNEKKRLNKAVLSNYYTGNLTEWDTELPN